MHRAREEDIPRLARQLDMQGIRGRQGLLREPALRDHRAADEMHLRPYVRAHCAVGIEAPAPAARGWDDRGEEQRLIEREIVRVAIEVETRGLVSAVNP